VLVVLFLPTACGSGRGAAGDRNDASAYARAAKRFQAIQDRAGDVAFTRVRGALDRCPPAVGGRRRLLVSTEAEEFQVPVRGQIALPGFRRLSADLASVEARDAGLREIAGAAATITREDEKLGRAGLDFCRFLKAWQAASWSRSFPDAYYARLCRDAGYAAADVARAEDRIQERVLGLARLGLSTKQQLDLYTSLLSPLFAVCNPGR
jgi:hypothetical protein